MLDEKICNHEKVVRLRSRVLINICVIERIFKNGLSIRRSRMFRIYGAESKFLSPDRCI